MRLSIQIQDFKIMPYERDPEPIDKSKGNIPINQREHSRCLKVEKFRS